MKKPFAILVSLLFWSAFAAVRADEAAPTETPTPVVTDYDSFVKGYSENFITQYDKFKKETDLITANDFSIDHLDFLNDNGASSNIRLQVLCVIPDKVTKKNAIDVTIWFRSYTDEWRWLNCKSFIWLVDGKDFTWRNELYNGNVATEGSGVEETHTVFLTVKQFDALCKAKTIEFQACNESFSFAQAHLWTLKYMNQKLHEVLSSKAAK